MTSSPAASDSPGADSPGTDSPGADLPDDAPPGTGRRRSTEKPANLSPRARRFAEALAQRAESGRRVRLPDFWHILDAADPPSRTDVRRRRILADIFDELAAFGRIHLPAAPSFDRAESPPLPLFVTLPARTAAAAAAARRRVVWHPALAWVAESDSRLTPSQREALERVNQWLYHRRTDQVVPMRERSLEIFGQEKLLERLAGTAVFGPGRLGLELLRCRRVVPGFQTEEVGDGDILLVVENCDTWDSLTRVLRDTGGHRVGLVGWGAGAAFEASVASVGRLGRPVGRVVYFGDVDEKGLAIPGNAAALAAREGLPLLRPATGLYDAIFRLARRQPGPKATRPAAAADLASWLDKAHREGAVHLLTHGQRLAQEAVGLAYLTRHDDWLAGLA